MRTPCVLAGLLGVALGTVTLEGAQAVVAAEKSIEIPKGTKAEKIGPGHVRFTLPNLRVIDVTGYDARTGAIGLVQVIDPDPPTRPADARTAAKIIDPQPPGKVEITASQARLVKLRVLTRAAARKLPAADDVTIDDEITWLPARITDKDGVRR
ncbi:MAG TPA: hypothetical protein PLE61_01505 [Vicinamibacterales bacterium]|nr:hypothetical protein [Vicinamibacterales bacterium]HPW19463.1 hypothetical protein [Vicinamibacterales bacterium]